MLAFIAYDKVHIVTIIGSDVSGVTILINIDLLIQQAFTICIQDYGNTYRIKTPSPLGEGHATAGTL